MQDSWKSTAMLHIKVSKNVYVFTYSVFRKAHVSKQKVLCLCQFSINYKMQISNSHFEHNLVRDKLKLLVWQYLLRVFTGLWMLQTKFYRD